MKAKLTAVIPVVQYGNISPEIEAEAETYEEAMAICEARLTSIWNKYVEEGKQLPTNNRVKLHASIGGDIWYDKLTHTYTNEQGEVYQSGSQYADSFRKLFDKLGIASKMALKFGVSADDILSMWDLKSQASRNLGTAIHAALQLEEQYRGLGESLGKSGAHEHPLLKTIVDSFLVAHSKELARNEVLIVSHNLKRAGRIDRLLIVDEKRVRIQDYKSNTSIDKELEFYWKQLEFYKSILEDNGWTVEGLDIFHHNGIKWEEYHHEYASHQQNNHTTTSVARQGHTTTPRPVRTRTQPHNHQSPQLPKPILHGLQNSPSISAGNYRGEVWTVQGDSHTPGQTNNSPGEK